METRYDAFSVCYSNFCSCFVSQILSVSQSAGSPAVSLIYVVHNRSETLNGTMASNLLSRLTAELVGYFLFYPPLITAERKSFYRCFYFGVDDEKENTFN